MQKSFVRIASASLMVIFMALSLGPTPGNSRAFAQNNSSTGNSQPNNCQTFPETGKTVCGKFLTYWNAHGGLRQQGYPISNEFQEKSDVDGKTYTVQYFERAVFEMHPENQPPYDVLLSLLGTMRLKEKYPNGPPAPPTAVNPQCGQYF